MTERATASTADRSSAAAGSGERVRRAFPTLLLFVVGVFAVAAFGSLFPPGPWYEGLDKPSFTPPPWVFAPAWTALYLTIALAGWLVWRRRGWRGAPAAWLAYTLQLLLNGAWSFLFFGLQRPGLAFGEILVQWLVIATTIALFWREHRGAALLLVPYLLWVSFAALLNHSLWVLNA